MVEVTRSRDRKEPVMKRFADSAARFASGLFMWLFAIAGLLMLPQIVFWPGVLLFAAYVLFNVRRGERGSEEPVIVKDVL